MVHIYIACNSPSFHVIKNIKSSANIKNIVRFQPYLKKTVLHLYGSEQDPMESHLDKGKVFKNRWACLPLCFRFYHQHKEILDSSNSMEFQSKHQQAVSMIDEVAAAFPDADITVVADSWFGNSGMWKPLRNRLGKRAHMISRLRANNNLFAQPEARKTGTPARPRKYGKKIGSPLSLAVKYRDMATEYKVDLYGRKRSVYAYDMMIMLKTLKCAVRVVWIYRKTQWLALYSLVYRYLK